MNQHHFISNYGKAFMDDAAYVKLQKRVNEKYKPYSRKRAFDVIVLGVGSMGSSTCYHLAKKGYSVLGLEQFAIPHELGSHTGQSRIIRKAYGEDSDYVPMLEKSYENWKSLESESGLQVYFPTGLAYFGLPGKSFLNTVKKSAKKYAIDINRLEHVECSKKYPAFNLPADFEIIEEPDAGFLLPDRAILLYTDQAQQNGADIRCQEKVISWSRENNKITVKTDKGDYEAKKLIITAGPWAGELIPELSSKLKVTRQVLSWVQPRENALYEMGKFPCWMLEDETFHFYGFPMLPPEKFGGPSGFKLALHHPVGEVVDPDKVDRSTKAEDGNLLIKFINTYLSKGHCKIINLITCLYTNSPDSHFVIDFIPEHDQDVVFAAGFSGHGFKFSSVVGEVLADLAIEGKTTQPIHFLRGNRFK